MPLHHRALVRVRASTLHGSIFPATPHGRRAVRGWQLDADKFQASANGRVRQLLRSRTRNGVPGIKRLERNVEGCWILILEDRWMVAAAMAAALQAHAAKVSIAAELREALPVLDVLDFWGALIDEHIPHGGAAVLCAELERRGIPCVTYSWRPAEFAEDYRRQPREVAARLIKKCGPLEGEHHRSCIIGRARNPWGPF